MASIEFRLKSSLNTYIIEDVYGEYGDKERKPMPTPRHLIVSAIEEITSLRAEVDRLTRENEMLKMNKPA